MIDYSSVRNEHDPIALSGEVIYESVMEAPNRKVFKRFVESALARALDHLIDPTATASYLTIFSPGQEPGEIRCQIDIETGKERAGFSVGFGLDPRAAFLDSAERLSWFEKNQPAKISV